MKNRTFEDYWSNTKWVSVTPQGYFIAKEAYIVIKDMCRNAYNAGLRQGKKKRPTGKKK